jgi:hypothetical protein
MKKYVIGQTGKMKYYDYSGHINSMTAFRVGTGTMYSFVQLDKNEVPD